MAGLNPEPRLQAAEGWEEMGLLGEASSRDGVVLALLSRGNGMHEVV